MGDQDLHPKVIYQPKGPKETAIVRFTKFVEEKYKIKLNDYWELHEWSCKNFPEFWECVWLYFDVISSKPYTEVFDRSKGFTNNEWFKGARLNYAENILRYRDDRTAVITVDDADHEEYISYRTVYEEACMYAAAMRNEGISKGDVVACYMANKKEALFAFLAAASIGAVWSGALPLMGSKGVVTRYVQCNPRILFASGNFSFQGKVVHIIDRIEEIVKGVSSIKKVVFVSTRGEEEDTSSIPNCCSIEQFLEPWRKKFQVSAWDLEFEQLPFNYPMCISFTSGTTGLPKGIVHCIGALLTSVRGFGIHMESTRDDVIFNSSPVGWISWHATLNCLYFGLTLCMYEGDPFHGAPTRFWDLVDRYRFSSITLWSSVIDSMELEGKLPTPRHKLDSVTQVFAIGSPLKPQGYEIISEKIKPGIFCGSVYGMTECFGMLSGVDPNLPVHKGELQCFALGFDLRCLDEEGNSVVGKRGEFVLATPIPAMSGLLNDDDHQKLSEAYLSKYPGFWYLGDDVWINPVTKGFIVYGRSDETLNPKGARFNCGEIYFALEGFPGMMDCVCVSQFNKSQDERVVLFVQMAPGHSLTADIEQKIRTTIEDTLTFEHVPEVIMEVPDIPYNLTGKKLNILVKKLVNKQQVSSTETVVNPESVEFFKNLKLGDF